MITVLECGFCVESIWIPFRMMLQDEEIPNFRHLCEGEVLDYDSEISILLKATEVVNPSQSPKDCSKVTNRVYGLI